MQQAHRTVTYIKRYGYKVLKNHSLFSTQRSLHSKEPNGHATIYQTNQITTEYNQQSNHHTLILPKAWNLLTWVRRTVVLSS